MKDNEKDLNPIEKEVEKKAPNTLQDLAMGAGISLATYFLIWSVTRTGSPITYVVLMDALIIACFGILVVKFFRTNHVSAAVVMLILIAPVILGLLLLGSCGLILSGL